MSDPTPSRPQADEPLDLLIEAAEIVSRHTLDLDHLLGRLVGLVSKVVDAELVAIMLKMDDDSLKIRFARGYDEDVAADLRVKLGKGITGAAAASRQTIVVNDVAQDPRYIEAAQAIRAEMAVPLIARGDLVGVIDLQSTQIGAFGDQEHSLLELIASHFSIAIEAARLYRATMRQNRVLKTLSEIAQEFSRILKLDQLLSKIASLIHPMIPYDALSILLLEESDTVLKHYFGVRYDERIQWDNVKLGVGIVGRATETKRPVLVRDTHLDDRYVAVIDGIRSEVAIPLMLKDKVIGVIDLECEQVDAFTSQTVQTLSLLAPQIATAIENACLYEQVAHNEARMERDLAAARALQENLLYAATPEFPGVEIAAHNEAALEVTGDLYDFFPTPGLVVGNPYRRRERQGHRRRALRGARQWAAPQSGRIRPVARRPARHDQSNVDGTQDRCPLPDGDLRAMAPHRARTCNRERRTAAAYSQAERQGAGAGSRRHPAGATR
jgi:sigma-B regulation protein RsbU (phosphoserine phosphatase)